jgi:hypothetical protein
MPFMVLPSTMPSSGIAYCGAYQGSVPITRSNASTVTVNDETNIDRVPTPKPQPPTKRRFCRTITSRPATASITAASKATQSGCALSNSTLSTRPIRNNCTVLRSSRNQQRAFDANQQTPRQPGEGQDQERSDCEVGR